MAAFFLWNEEKWYQWFCVSPQNLCFFDTPSPQVLDDFRNVSWNILKGKSVLFKNVCKSENTLWILLFVPVTLSSLGVLKSHSIVISCRDVKHAFSLVRAINRGWQGAGTVAWTECSSFLNPAVRQKCAFRRGESLGNPKKQSDRGSGGARLSSQQSGGRGRQLDLSSRPVWSIKWVPGQPWLHRETLVCVCMCVRVCGSL